MPFSAEAEISLTWNIMELQLSQEQAAEVLASLHETRGTWTELHINRKDGHGS